MRTSIKIKFSIFLAALLLFTVFLLSLLVLRGIKTNQQGQYEQYLARLTETANTYFLQTILAESNKDTQSFLHNKGKDFADQLTLISGQQVILYDKDGLAVNKKLSFTDTENMKTALAYALNNKTAYMIEKDSLYYLSPLKTYNEQAGVIQFYYSLTDNQHFYNQIQKMFIYIGGTVFLLSFLFAYFYFNIFANGIIRLVKTVERIGEGDYETSPLSRRDEIGRLSTGIQKMSQKIRKNIENMEEEQKKLTLAVNKLSMLDKQQKQFIGSVTHEFKTPLTSIKAYIDLLEMYPDDEELLSTARLNIKSETERLYDMVEKVLKLAALDKYEFELNKEPTDIRHMLLSVVASVQGKIDKFGLRLDLDLTEAYVEADKDSLTIVLVNLVDNAIKYNRTNGSIQIKSYKAADQVIIEITNTGAGIPKEAAEKIFEPFYTVDKNRARQNGGAGLGLSLAKEHAELLGGNIALVNTSADETSFRVTFPISLP
ncbi:HAMP domain-containing sensor histidine kinase [Clostridium sp. KNHs205]|uniref:sensor histidine kinase n=1 Tax=Clostridium sp. KNHs205 TaxID=1449050 RepID=UPI00051B7CC9|nr:HAMP domain-containing sensor histidine kinase [Clostridium sp. KNHs205]